MPLRKIASSLILLALLLPLPVMASEPVGPGMAGLTLLILIPAVSVTSLYSLGLLLFPPRTPRLFNIFLGINVVLHLILFVSWYNMFDYDDRKQTRFAAYRQLAFHHSGNGNFPFTITMMEFLFWGIMITHLLWKKYKKRKAGAIER